MSERGGWGTQRCRKGSLANGGGDFAIERLTLRGTGFGADGGGSFSHWTSTGEEGCVVRIGGRGVKTVDWSGVF